MIIAHNGIVSMSPKLSYCPVKPEQHTCSIGAGMEWGGEDDMDLSNLV